MAVKRLKSYLRNHNGLSDETKNKLIDGLFEAKVKSILNFVLYSKSSI